MNFISNAVRVISEKLMDQSLRLPMSRLHSIPESLEVRLLNMWCIHVYKVRHLRGGLADSQQLSHCIS